VPWGRKKHPFFLHMGLGELLGGYAPGHPNQKGLSRLPHPDFNNRKDTGRFNNRTTNKFIFIFNKIINSRHITLIVWGVPWGRNCGGEGGGKCPRAPKSKGFI